MQEELRVLVALEAECCPSLVFELRAGEELVLEVRRAGGPDQAGAGSP